MHGLRMQTDHPALTPKWTPVNDLNYVVSLYDLYE